MFSVTYDDCAILFFFLNAVIAVRFPVQPIEK
jgi:hypothetical protein